MAESIRRASDGQDVEKQWLLQDRKEASNPQSKVVDTTFDLSSTSVGLAKQPYDQKYHLPDSLGRFRTPIIAS
jgi:hypothetical protein